MAVVTLVKLLLVAVVVAAATAVTTTTTMAQTTSTPTTAPGFMESHRITNLPGLPPDTTARRMYAGLLPIAPGKQVFYWLMEADSGFASAPLSLWTNGGPGCSGMYGLFTENSPLRSTSTGGLVSNAEDAWTRVSSMLYVEIPVGVGFSRATPRLKKYSNEQTAQDNVAFLQAFFKAFPALQSRPLYLTSESFGGVYLPTLARAILRANVLPQFAGFFVGNPYFYSVWRDVGEFQTFRGRALIPKRISDAFDAKDCASGTNIYTKECSVLVRQARLATSGIDDYAIDYPVCPSPLLNLQAARAFLSAEAQEKLALLEFVGVDVDAVLDNARNVTEAKRNATPWSKRRGRSTPKPTLKTTPKPTLSPTCLLYTSDAADD